MDLDVIVNARVKASVRGFVTEIEALGFVLDGMSPPNCSLTAPGEVLRPLTNSHRKGSVNEPISSLRRPDTRFRSLAER